MREECVECGIKHVSRANAQLDECLLGYPEHWLLAVGELAEASAELVAKYPDIARRIRDLRLRLMEDPLNFKEPLLPLLMELWALSNADADESPETTEPLKT